MSKPEGFSLEAIIRPNILKLQPYRCARDDYSEGILLDANENALGPSLAASTSASTSKAPSATATNGVNGDHAPANALKVQDEEYAALQLHRYPSPTHNDIKERFASYRHFRYGASGTFLGVGSDEIIDLLIRVTCIPGSGTGDKILICPPTYGMYPVCACVNDVDVIRCNLETEKGTFQPRIDSIYELLSGPDAEKIKLLFLTSPGNPTGSTILPENIRKILDHPTWRGLVIIDEAYIDFSSTPSAVTLFDEGYQNLIVMQTLSKGFGLAGIRVGISFQSPEMAQILANTKAPYSIGTPTATLALRALSTENIKATEQKAKHLKRNRTWLLEALRREFSDSLAPALGNNDANFIMVPVYSKAGPPQLDNVRSAAIYKRLAEEKGVVVRFRGNEVGCEACLRITIGTDEECQAVVDKLREAFREL